MSEPLFSIITIAYNSEKTIERTINSVLMQSFKNYEYIIVDGASKDGTLDIVKKYEPLFEGRMKWKSEPDKGIYNAMNKGIERSIGRIIGIVNSDDWLEPNALQIVSDTFYKEKCDVVCGQMYFHYGNGSKQLMRCSETRMKHYLRYLRMGINHPATFVLKSLYDKIGLFDENIVIHADTDLLIRMNKVDTRFIFLDDILTNMSDGGASNVNNKRSKADREYILRKHTSSYLQKISLQIFDRCYGLLKQVLPVKYVRFIRNK